MKTKQAGKTSMSQQCIRIYTNSEKGASKHDNIKKYCCKAVISVCLFKSINGQFAGTFQVMVL